MARFFADRGDAQIFFALFNGGLDGDSYAIGAATRSGETWSEHGANPVLEAGSVGAWDDDHVKDPCLLWDGAQFVCYYAGNDGTTYRIGRATAPAHTGPWTKSASNPVLNVGAGGAIDDAGCAFPVVLYEPTDTGKEWKMWCRADDGSAQTVAYAHSTDGISWTKVGRVINLGAGGSWNDEGVLPSAIVKVAGTYYLFVGGRQGTTNPKWQGGLWTFTDPEGTYTPASNPVFLARFNDGLNTTQQPTADVGSGATIVSLTTPAAFNVGEPVALVDGSGLVDPEIFYLTTIGGSTVTLDHATSAAFESSGGVLRSFAYNSVIPRSVLPRSSGGYEAFMAVFQPVEDLSAPGSKLFEGSLEMRADDLDGPWTYNYVAGRGLLFPLEPIGAGWHTRSAENPSVIAAP